MQDGWTWDPASDPTVLEVLASETARERWHDDLETAPSDPVTGKVLCVVAGIALARAVLEQYERPDAFQEGVAMLDLAEHWVDDPTDARFAAITRFLFEDDTEWPDDDPRNIVWWALRVATSSVGNFEAGWALQGVVDRARNAQIDALGVARRAVMARSR